MKHDIKLIRAALGLTQVQLADLIGVSQASISQWENSTQSMEPRNTGVIENLFYNKDAKLDELVVRLIRTQPLVSVRDKADRVLHISPLLAKVLNRSPDEIIGAKYSDVVDENRVRTDCPDTPWEDRIYREVSHDFVSSAKNGGKRFGLNCKEFYLEIESAPRILISFAEISQPTNMPPKLTRCAAKQAVHAH